MPTLEKPWTPEQEAEARRWIELDHAEDPGAQRLYLKLERELGETAWEALSDFVDSKTPVEDDEADTFDGEMPEAIRPDDDFLPDPQNSGYAVGRCGEMMSLGRQGSPAGKVLIPVRQWRAGKGGKKYLMYGYRIRTGNGERKFIPMFQVGMNRFEAERRRRQNYQPEGV